MESLVNIIISLWDQRNHLHLQCGVRVWSLSCMYQLNNGLQNPANQRRPSHPSSPPLIGWKSCGPYLLLEPSRYAAMVAYDLKCRAASDEGEAMVSTRFAWWQRLKTTSWVMSTYCVGKYGGGCASTEFFKIIQKFLLKGSLAGRQTACPRACSLFCISATVTISFCPR